MSVREELIQALEVGDVLAIRRVGWADLHEAAATWWAPRQGCTTKQLVPYAKLLGDEEPAEVLEAFRECAGDWRPTPGALRGYLNRKRGETTVDVGRGRDRASTPHALAAVADAYRRGERRCPCPGHASTWKIDQSGVLRCRVDNGLEPGQLYTAQDAGLLDVAGALGAAV